MLSKNKPTLFVLLSRFPFPLEKGDKLRAFYQLKGLAESYDIVLCCLYEQAIQEAHYAEVSRYCKEIHLLKLSKLGLLWQVVLNLFSSRPFQVAYFYRQQHFRTIQQLLQKHKPDHIFCQLLRVADYVKGYTLCPKTIDYMDALSKGMERRINTEPWYKSWFFKLEFKRLADYEGQLFDLFDQKVIISLQDLNFINHPKRSEIQVIPNGVDESFFDFPAAEKKYDLLFTGNFNYPPNIEGATYLVNEILPILRQKGFDLRLMLSGSDPHPRIKALASDRVTVTGWVDDIRTSYAQSKIFVAPMFIGTGLQNKLLEAMAMELPCITTKLANNALGATDEKNILLAEESDEFADKTIRLLTQNEVANQIKDNAKNFVLENYSWKKQNNLLISLIQKGRTK